MSPEDFVKCFSDEKAILLEQYFSANQSLTQGISSVNHMLQQLSLNKAQMDGIYSIVDTVLTDALYSILLGLDGEASLGGRQELYKLFDEKGNELTGTGEIEAFAYKYFHGIK